MISLLIHLTLAYLISNFNIPEPINKLLKRLEHKRERIFYVKILDIPKPKVKEKPKEKNTPIISQFTTRKKGPLGKQEKSMLSGESSVLEPKPGLPFKIPGSIALPTQKSAKSSGKKNAAKKQTKEGKKKLAKAGKGLKNIKKAKKKEEKKIKKNKPSNKLAMKLPEVKPKVVPPLPKRKIPLIDPRLVSKESKKIVPQMGEGESVEISLDTTESKYISYFKHIRDKLYLVWRYPPEAAAAGIQGTVKILFVIERDGKLKDVRILETSGFPVLDREAVRAIIAAAPFGPFPPDWTEKELRIRARFIYHLFSRAPF